jgi:hypothetical protein
MKILIPASGGVNSAYSLHQFLSTTDHEIVALHFSEGYDGAPNERSEFDAICDWLSANVRTFERSYVTLPQISNIDDMRPVRAGFVKNITYAFATARYENYATQIAAHSADAIAIGISVENTATDRHPILIDQVYQTGAAVYLPSISITDAVPADANYDTIAAQMSGRFEQYDALPVELQALITSCDVNTCTDIWCLRCAYQRGYNQYVSNGQTGRVFDRWCAEQGSYGPWRSAADPTDYVWRGGCCDECAVHNYLADLVGRDWPSVVDTRNRITWLSENGADMTGVETEEQLGDFCGRMGRINLDRGVNSDGMTGDEYWSAILAAERL